MASAPVAPASPRRAGAPGDRGLHLRPDFSGEMVEIRPRIRAGLRDELNAMSARGEARSQGHAVRVLLREAILARVLRAVCVHRWERGVCTRCQRTEAEAFDPQSAELVLAFPSPSHALRFKRDPTARAISLAGADWMQGAFVPMAI